MLRTSRRDSSVWFLRRRGLDLNLGESMDVRKCIVPLCTLNNRRDTSPLVRLVEGEDDPSPSSMCSPSNLRWNRAKSYCHL
ncbi:hypothetical protein TNCV_302221 [Trichonephila clavipes]|nr:hypothetical protein TNCV_302221 [Trichonephila clavipes]